MERLDLTDLVELRTQSCCSSSPWAFERKVELRSQAGRRGGARATAVAVCGNAPLLRKLAGTLLDNAWRMSTGADEGGSVDTVSCARAPCWPA